jgi:hypothetical protein
MRNISFVFQLLAKDQCKIILFKCSIAQREIKYLECVISAKGVGSDPAKVATIANWPVPVSIKELRGFLGLAGYYRKFVKHFGVVCKPLTDLLKKNTIFLWTTVHEDSFQALKHALCHAPIMVLPDLLRNFLWKLMQVVWLWELWLRTKASFGLY